MLFEPVGWRFGALCGCCHLRYARRAIACPPGGRSNFGSLALYPSHHGETFPCRTKTRPIACPVGRTGDGTAAASGLDPLLGKHILRQLFPALPTSCYPAVLEKLTPILRWLLGAHSADCCTFRECLLSRF